ncbi:MAG TPA: hypothetical protein VLX31_04550 [Streptosporangiaceae bacterium]|nr:hypothetical protein [Streptosporangiaceae bacterium]
MHPVLRAALNDASIPVNPAAWVKLGKIRRTRPLLWTEARTDRWRKTGEVPASVMVWSREQAGRFLDHSEGDRLSALWRVALYARAATRWSSYRRARHRCVHHRPVRDGAR